MTYNRERYLRQLVGAIATVKFRRNTLMFFIPFVFLLIGILPIIFAPNEPESRWFLAVTVFVMIPSTMYGAWKWIQTEINRYEDMLAEELV